MKVLVAYFSLSGNTKKIAQAIYEKAASEGHEVILKDSAEITPDSFNDFDLVFLGSACHDADLAEPVKLILEGISGTPSYKIAGFVTHATTMPEGGEKNEKLYEQWAGRCEKTLEKASQQKGFDLAGYFHCQGLPSPPIEEFIHNEILPGEDEWEEYITEVRQHPNQEDIEQAKAFALQVLS